MSTTPDVPYRMQFSVEVPGTPEQVWQAIATAPGLSSWFLPTVLEEREGGALRFEMGEGMGSDGHVTRWDPPRVLAYEEDWATLMGTSPDELSPMTSEFVVEARSGGTCVVRVTTSGFGIGADWEQEWWDDMQRSWMPSFDVLRLYLAGFAGQHATPLEASALHPGDEQTLWHQVRDELGLAEEGQAFELRGSTGTVEGLGDRHALVRLHAPVPGLLTVGVHGADEGEVSVGVRGYLFGPDAATYARDEQPAWQTWLDGLVVPA